MAPTPTSLTTLSNPQITTQQLLTFKTKSTEASTSQDFRQSLLTNSAGVLLRLPQEVIAQALVLLQRYQVASAQDGALPGKVDGKMISAAVVYVTAKLSFTPLNPRSVINVYAYLESNAAALWYGSGVSGGSQGDDPKSYYVSAGTYEREKIRLFAAETHVLATLGFDTHVVLPHSLALTYLQALGRTSTQLASKVFGHLNGGLMSPQLVYLTHQPNALAVAAIYLSAREVGIKLVEENWWEVFDVDREDLGFLVFAFGSLSNFATAERKKAGGARDEVLSVG